jgi:hypothetical protein
MIPSAEFKNIFVLPIPPFLPLGPKDEKGEKGGNLSHFKDGPELETCMVILYRQTIDQH